MIKDKMIKDKILQGIAVGLLADAVKLTINFMSFLLGYTDVVFWQITASRFLAKEYLFGTPALIVGAVADITVSAGLGVAFVYFIYIFGNRDLWIKGIGFGLFVWVVLFGSLLGQSVAAKIPQNVSGIFVTIVAHFGYGFALAFFTKLVCRTEQEKVPNQGIARFKPLPVSKKILIKKNDEEKNIILKKSKK
ncbi:MAG: hypothetical protein ACOYVD_08610 [Bacillota bacterium]